MVINEQVRINLTCIFDMRNVRVHTPYLERETYIAYDDGIERTFWHSASWDTIADVIGVSTTTLFRARATQAYWESSKAHVLDSLTVPFKSWIFRGVLGVRHPDVQVIRDFELASLEHHWSMRDKGQKQIGVASTLHADVAEFVPTGQSISVDEVIANIDKALSLQ